MSVVVKSASSVSWEMEKLGMVCEVLDKLRKPITKKDRVAGPYPYYGATGVLDYVEGFIFNEALVLIGEDGAKWGPGDRSAFSISGTTWVNNHAHVLKPDRSRLLDQWLISYLNYSDLSDFISGMTVPKLNQGKLREIPIPVPPLPEQERIVAILDEAFEGIATATTHAQRNLDNARELFQSVLQSTFEQKGEDWVETTLTQCCAQIFAGGDVPKGRVFKERSEQFSVPIFSNGAKDEGLYGFTDVARVLEPAVTVSARGTIGFTAIRTEPFLPVVRLIVLVPDLNKICLKFLFYVVAGLEFGNTGTSIPQLTVPNFKKSPVSLPTLDQQKTIVQKLDALSAETRRLEAVYQRKLAALAELKQSLLQRAFAGEL